MGWFGRKRLERTGSYVTDREPEHMRRVRARSHDGDVHAMFRTVYDMKEVIGEGGFGEVWRVTHKKTGEDAAVKIMSVRDGGHRAKDTAGILREIEFLQNLSHRSVIRLLEVYRKGKQFYVVTEWCSGGELLGELLENGLYQEEEAKRVMWELIKGVSYIHSKGIVHRDLKLENILLRKAGNRVKVKIADFGLSAHIGEGKLNSLSGSVLYVAPEILRASRQGSFDDPLWRPRPYGDAGDEDLNAAYDHRVDVWSLGVCLYILLTGHAPFGDGGAPAAEVFKAVEDGHINFSRKEFDGISEGAKDFIRGLLTQDPARRITLDEALMHPWLQTAGDDAGLLRMWSSGEAEDITSPKNPASRGGGHFAQVARRKPATPRTEAARAVLMGRGGLRRREESAKDSWGSADRLSDLQGGGAGSATPGGSSSTTPTAGTAPPVSQRQRASVSDVNELRDLWRRARAAREAREATAGGKEMGARGGAAAGPRAGMDAHEAAVEGPDPHPGLEGKASSLGFPVDDVAVSNC